MRLVKAEKRASYGVTAHISQPPYPIILITAYHYHHHHNHRHRHHHHHYIIVITNTIHRTYNFLDTIKVYARDLTGEDDETFADVSWGHNSGLMMITSTGRAFAHYSPGNYPELTPGLRKYLEPDEILVKSLGSQASYKGYLTSKGRVLALKTWNDSSHDIEVFIVDPVCTVTKTPFNIEKAAFGHVNWSVITDTKEMYLLSIHDIRVCQKAPQTNNLWKKVPKSDGLKIVASDHGSAHEGFITEDGDVYTWGNGTHGCLGHGSTTSENVPRRVDFYHNNNMKAVAIGCGGHSSWSGGFTLVLLDDNRLFYSGYLGAEKQLVPVEVPPESFNNRRIRSIAAGENWAAIITTVPR